MSFRPVFYLVSFVGADELARRLANQQGITVIMSQVVPPPNRHDPSPLLTGEAGYVTLLKRYSRTINPISWGLRGSSMRGCWRACGGLVRSSRAGWSRWLKPYPRGKRWYLKSPALGPIRCGRLRRNSSALLEKAEWPTHYSYKFITDLMNAAFLLPSR